MIHFGSTKSNVISSHYHQNLHIYEAGKALTEISHSLMHSWSKHELCARPCEWLWRQDRPELSSHRAELGKGQDDNETIIAHLISLPKCDGACGGLYQGFPDQILLGWGLKDGYVLKCGWAGGRELAHPGWWKLIVQFSEILWACRSTQATQALLKIKLHKLAIN